MFNLIIMLVSTLNSEPRGSNNHTIALYLLEHLDELKDHSITEIADACYVSNSSISRFCRHIGLEDFNELKAQIYRFYQVRDTKFNFEKKDKNNLAQSYLNQVIKNMERLKASLDEQIIDQLVKDIYEYNTVYAFGYLQSEYTALNLQSDIISSGKVIHTSINFSEQLSMIKNASKDDLIIIFSLSGNYFDRAYKNRELNKDKTQGKVYMITGNELSKKDPNVDVVIKYDAVNDFAGHPFPANAISNIIALKYAILCSENK